MAEAHYYVITGRRLKPLPDITDTTLESFASFYDIEGKVRTTWEKYANQFSLELVHQGTVLTDCIFLLHTTGTYRDWEEGKEVQKAAPQLVWAMRVINGVPGNVTTHDMRNGLLAKLEERMERNEQ